MATFTKSRKTAPLAEGELMISGAREYITVSVMTDERTEKRDRATFVSLRLSTKEAVRVAGMVAGMETNDPWESGHYRTDDRTTAQKLRALADKLEERKC